jgi:hypothetical protein
MAKGPRRNKFTCAVENIDIMRSVESSCSRQDRLRDRAVLGPWIASDSASTTERNRRRPWWVVEDSATEEGAKMA